MTQADLELFIVAVAYLLFGYALGLTVAEKRSAANWDVGGIHRRRKNRRLHLHRQE
jgi:hypothetical protein